MYKKANVIFFGAKPASKTAWTQKLWMCDFRTNVHMTLKTKKLVKSDFDEFIECYKAEDRSHRKDTWKADRRAELAMTNQRGRGITVEGRWCSFTCEDLFARDKTNLDIFWLKDESLEDTENLPAPEILAAEIVEQLEAALL